MSETLSNWDVTAAWVTVLITLAISIITPAITTFLNNCFQLKMKKMELSHQDKETHYMKKVSVYEGCLQDIGKFLHFMDNQNHSSLGEHLYELYLYLPEQHWTTLDTLLTALANNAYLTPDTQNQLIELSKILSKELLSNESYEKKVKKHNPRK